MISVIDVMDTVHDKFWSWIHSKIRAYDNRDYDKLRDSIISEVETWMNIKESEEAEHAKVTKGYRPQDKSY